MNKLLLLFVFLNITTFSFSQNISLNKNKEYLFQALSTDTINLIECKYDLRFTISEIGEVKGDIKSYCNDDDNVVVHFNGDLNENGIIYASTKGKKNLHHLEFEPNNNSLIYYRTKSVSEDGEVTEFEKTNPFYYGLVSEIDLQINQDEIIEEKEETISIVKTEKVKNANIPNEVTSNKTSKDKETDSGWSGILIFCFIVYILYKVKNKFIVLFRGFTSSLEKIDNSQNYSQKTETKSYTQTKSRPEIKQKNTIIQVQKNQDKKDQTKRIRLFYCEYCGKSYSSIHALSHAKCESHPNGRMKGFHKVYEGTEKSKYSCKYCGKSYSTIHSMTHAKCERHPNGRMKGFHSPTL